MPIITKTVTPQQMENIERLNRDSRYREEQVFRRQIGTVCYEAPTKGEGVCDACQRPVKERCYNVVISDSEVRLTIQQPLPDVEDGVVLRYHDRCYPKGLYETVSVRSGSRNPDNDD